MSPSIATAVFKDSYTHGVMIHEILPVGLLQCNCSVFGDETSREAIVVDPGAEIGEIEKILQKHQLTVKAIVVTHAHIDHVAGAQELKRKTGAPVYLNENDQELLSALDVQAQWLGVQTPEKVHVDTNAVDGTAISLGGSDFQVMHTPGHTQGSISVFIPQQNMLIAGDTLFRDSIGRTDLPGGNSRQILSSIKTSLLVLPEETVVLPGHGPKTTIGREKEKNPFLQNL
jgi:glyoxylase-like metal-dependent hydrolase (beta-lactamase superfamily II)